MNKSKNKKYTVKKSSNGVQSKGLLQTLQKMILEKSGSVSYIFKDTRISNIHSNDLKDLEEYQIRSVLHTNLGFQAIDGKSPNDLIHMFETTRISLGAQEFKVN